MLHHVAGFRQGEVAQKLGVCRRTVLYRLARFEAHIWTNQRPANSVTPR